MSTIVFTTPSKEELFNDLKTQKLIIHKQILKHLSNYDIATMTLGYFAILVEGVKEECPEATFDSVFTNPEHKKIMLKDIEEGIEAFPMTRGFTMGGNFKILRKMITEYNDRL